MRSDGGSGDNSPTTGRWPGSPWARRSTSSSTCERSSSEPSLHANVNQRAAHTRRERAGIARPPLVHGIRPPVEPAVAVASVGRASSSASRAWPGHAWPGPAWPAPAWRPLGRPRLVAFFAGARFLAGARRFAAFFAGARFLAGARRLAAFFAGARFLAGARRFAAFFAGARFATRLAGARRLAAFFAGARFATRLAGARLVAFFAAAGAPFCLFCGPSPFGGPFRRGSLLHGSRHRFLLGFSAEGTRARRATVDQMAMAARVHP